MKWEARLESLILREFIIKYDNQVGYYLYVFENGKCTYDHLEDSLELAIDTAFDEYNVPKDIWKIINEKNKRS